MLDSLVKEGRKLITIIDPHIKVEDDYFIYKDLLEKKLYVAD
jgi:alpha 1,3-glucosidase